MTNSLTLQYEKLCRAKLCSLLSPAAAGTIHRRASQTQPWALCRHSPDRSRTHITFSLPISPIPKFPNNFDARRPRTAHVCVRCGRAGRALRSAVGQPTTALLQWLSLVHGASSIQPQSLCYTQTYTCVRVHDALARTRTGQRGRGGRGPFTG